MSHSGCNSCFTEKDDEAYPAFWGMMGPLRTCRPALAGEALAIEKAKIREALVGGQPWRGNGSRVLHREAKIRKALVGRLPKRGPWREALAGRPLPGGPYRETLAGRPLPGGLCPLLRDASFSFIEKDHVRRPLRGRAGEARPQGYISLPGRPSLGWPSWQTETSFESHSGCNSCFTEKDDEAYPAFWGMMGPLPSKLVLGVPELCPARVVRRPRRVARQAPFASTRTPVPARVARRPRQGRSPAPPGSPAKLFEGRQGGLPSSFRECQSCAPPGSSTVPGRVACQARFGSARAVPRQGRPSCCREALVAVRPSLPGGPRCREALVAGRPSLPGRPSLGWPSCRLRATLAAIRASQRRTTKRTRPFGA